MAQRLVLLHYHTASMSARSSSRKNAMFLLMFCTPSRRVPDKRPSWQSHPLHRLYDAQIGRRKNSDQVSAAHLNWLRDWLACCFVGLHSVADGENDNAPPPTFEEFSERTTGFSNTVCLSVSYERCIASSAGLALWKPQAENVETVLLRRGDTIIYHREQSTTS